MGEKIDIGMAFDEYINVTDIIYYINVITKNSVESINFISIKDWEWNDTKESFDYNYDIEANRILIANIKLINDIEVGFYYYKQQYKYNLEFWISKKFVIENYGGLERFLNFMSLFLCKNYAKIKFIYVYIGIEVFLPNDKFNDILKEDSNIIQWIFPKEISTNNKKNIVIFKKVYINNRHFYYLRHTKN